jgi:Ca2+-binding RTX toxin-like protein
VPVGVAGATDGRDQITGSAADELISGVPTGSILNGRGSYDTLTGNGGNDTFILGTATSVYYSDGKANTTGAADLAAITDFNTGDRIQLKGSPADYRLSSAVLSGKSGTFLHWLASAGAGSADESIAFVQGMTPSTLSLPNSNQFIYL